MSRRVLLASFLLVLVVAGGGAVWAFTANGSALGEWLPWFKARPEKAKGKDRRNYVVGLGKLEPADGLQRLSLPMGDRVEIIRVKQDDVVREGQELARMESYALREADCELAKIRYREAQEQANRMQASAEAQIQQAELKRQQLAAVGPLEVEIANAGIEALKAKIERARKDEGNADGRQADMFRLERMKGEADLKVAETGVKRLKVVQDLELQAAEASIRALKAKRDAEIQQLSLKSLRRTADAAKLQLAKSVLKARRPGKVLKVVGSEGESAGPLHAIWVGDTRQMVVAAEVDETQIYRVRKGQIVIIDSPALHSDFDDASPITGKVLSVGEIVSHNQLRDTDPDMPTDQRVLPVRILLVDAARAAGYVEVQVKVYIETGPAPVR